MSHRPFRTVSWFAPLIALVITPPIHAGTLADTAARLSPNRGICALSGEGACEAALKVADATEMIVYVQLSPGEDLEQARRIVHERGLYNRRIYVDQGPLGHLHLGDSLVDVLVASADVKIPDAEALRVLRPQGKAMLGDRELIKPVPDGVDDWTHPYHGPDNNPQSADRLARAPYLTQFLSKPQYGPSPQVAVAAAGRVFKAFGNVAWHKREEAYLNKLVAFNGYNGTILWTYDLPDGYMVHRNTIIAMPELVYLGDDRSCKLIDAVTGKVTGQIAPPAEKAGGTFWKWMAIENDVLYALLGEQEPKDPVTKWDRNAHGWSWNEISKGYNRPDQPWGFGNHLIAVDTRTREMLWHRELPDRADARAVCMAGGRIFTFAFGSSLFCVDTSDGKILWERNRENARKLFEALGEYLNRQSWQTNWRTTNYLKCSETALYFAGPQVCKLVAVSTADGSLLWQHPYDNYQLLLREDGLYGISGPWGQNVSKKFNPETGVVLASLSTGRRGCTRITGSVDALFHRAMGGSVRFDVSTGRREWISPMRPSCHDGVTIANGLLYWWPWACDCQLQICGVVGLGPAGDFDFTPAIEKEPRRRAGPAVDRPVRDASSRQASDWPTFRKDNQCRATTPSAVPSEVRERWQAKDPRAQGTRPTAPVVSDGLVFVSGTDGVVRAFDVDNGALKWRAYTGGAVRFPPTVHRARVLVGSGDGWVYAFDKRDGALAWRFRAAPAEQRIPVYGSLRSRWPAASGVLVEDGIAYVAAGIVNYDGTYVYALDAVTGEMKWCNDTSGHLDPAARTGVSVQGHLLAHDGKLYLAGGTAVSPAVYDMGTGKCLNDPEPLASCASNSPRGSELALIADRVVAYGKPFYIDPATQVYDATVSQKILHASTGRRDVVWLNNAKLMGFDPIDETALAQCVVDTRDPQYKIQPWGKFEIDQQPRWQHDVPGSTAVAVCENAVVVAKPDAIVAFDLDRGRSIWSHPLETPVVPWGIAVDGEGRVIASLIDGSVLCLAGGVRDR